MIQLDHIGLAASSPSGLNRFRTLEATLQQIKTLGFDMVEISYVPYGLLINGELRQAALADFAAVLRNAGLRFSMHGLMRLNLAFDPRIDLCKQVMRAEIDICRAIGAGVLVYHSGLQALDALRHGLRRYPFSGDELAQGAKQEVHAFKEIAPYAADAGVIVGMENGDSHLWEHALLTRFGLPRQMLLQHHARLRIEPIVQQLEQIDHPNVGLTLDFAHLWIAANDMGFDYLASVAAATPWVKHLHMSDNFGRLDYGFDHEPDRWALGEADMHMPPGFGSIPLAEAFAALPEYRGDAILEIEKGFLDDAVSGRDHVLRLAHTDRVAHQGILSIS